MLLLAMPSRRRTRHPPLAPERVMITAPPPSSAHTAEIVRRCEEAGVTDIQTMPGNLLTGLTGANDRETYARASPRWRGGRPAEPLKPQPIPPSADWRIDLARGRPAHCQYCYLAGSLSGPPVTRVYANLDDVLAGIGTHAGRGTVTSPTLERGHEGTTFEMSCYTDPLGLGAPDRLLAAAVSRVGAGEFGSDVSCGSLPGTTGGGAGRISITVAAPGFASR